MNILTTLIKPSWAFCLISARQSLCTDQLYNHLSLQWLILSPRVWVSRTVYWMFCKIICLQLWYTNDFPSGTSWDFSVVMYGDVRAAFFYLTRDSRRSTPWSIIETCPPCEASSETQGQIVRAGGKLGRAKATALSARPSVPPAPRSLLGLRGCMWSGGRRKTI